MCSLRCTFATFVSLACAIVPYYHPLIRCCYIGRHQTVIKLMGMRSIAYTCS